MYIKYANTFVDPYQHENLEFHVFKQNGDDVIEGIFLHSKSNNIYPIIEGVPIFIKNRVLNAFWIQYKSQLLDIVKDENSIKSQIIAKNEEFSFSHEWEKAHKDNLTTVWGLTKEERLELFFNTLEVNESDIPNKLLLDVGCGNGILCKSLAEKGATVYGIDYSTSVWNAQKTMQHQDVCFLQADLHHLPFPNHKFDFVFSNGVLHHTPNTENAFEKVATKVKSGGKYYVWLYSRSNNFKINSFYYITDVVRFFTNKLPHSVQKVFIESLLGLKIVYCKLRGKKIHIADARTDIYDTLTPRYKFYHTVPETSGWFTKYGFINAKQTAFDPLGIGVLGMKK